MRTFYNVIKKAYLCTRFAGKLQLIHRFYQSTKRESMSQIQELDKEKLLRRKLDLLLKTGQMLVESAADTNRIIRNMNRVAAFLGLPEEHLHVYVQFNMLMVNLSDGEHSFFGPQI